AFPAAAEEWQVVKDGATAWAYEKSGTAKNEKTGFLHVRVARYHAEPQSDGAVSYQFDIRRYELDCAKPAVRQISNERMTKTGKAVAPAALIANNPWVPSSSGWPLRAKQFACDKTGLEGAVKSPNKAAAMVAMMGFGPKLSEIKATPSAATKPAVAATAAPDAFCTTIRKVLSDGQKETPFFKSFYLNEAERQKYAGAGSVAIEGFGACTIQQSLALPGRMSPRFGSYYCKKAADAATESAAFAAAVSKRVAACLPNAYLVESNDGGMTVKRYSHEVTMGGFPRVRVVHEKDNSVVLYLDTQGM
ncbi:MAG: hypothetical protein HOP13_15595, partial [Alphaproteobacteria bacterium]|nr:hypothetical protein [Alphaproteobacteria bacterium]